MLRNIELIAGIASAIMSMSAVIYRFFISRIFIKKPFELLLESLEKGHSIVSPEELRYQIKCSIPQKFDNDGNILSLKDVEKKIWKLSGNMYAIIGKPASGKTTAIRNLYYKMVKKKGK